MRKNEAEDMVAPGLVTGGSSFVVNQKPETPVQAPTSNMHRRESAYWRFFRNHTTVTTLLSVLAVVALFGSLWILSYIFVIPKPEVLVDMSTKAKDGLSFNRFAESGNAQVWGFVIPGIIIFGIMAALLLVVYFSWSDHMSSPNIDKKHLMGTTIVLLSIAILPVSPVIAIAVGNVEAENNQPSMTEQWAKLRYGVMLNMDDNASTFLPTNNAMIIEDDRKMRGIHADINGKFILSVRDKSDDKIYLYDMTLAKELPLTEAAK